MLQTNQPLSLFTSIIKDMVDLKLAAKDATQLATCLDLQKCYRELFFVWSMPNWIIDFSLATPLEKHLVTTITFLFAQIWDTNTEDKKIPFLFY